MLHLDVGRSSVRSLVVGHREKLGQTWLSCWSKEKEGEMVVSENPRLKVDGDQRR